MSARQCASRQLTPSQQSAVDDARALVAAHAVGEEELAAFLGKRMNMAPKDHDELRAWTLGWALADIRHLLQVVDDLTGGAR